MKKGRKIHEGPVYSKERTKQKFIDTVGKILRTEGYTALRVNRIAEVAGVNKKLIYVYFGSVDKLVQSYLKQQDYWTDGTGEVLPEINENVADYGEGQAIDLLTAQFEHLFQNKEMQRILAWQISEKNKLTRKLSEEREEYETPLFKLTQPLFDKTGIDMKATYAILLAGLYYLVLNDAVSSNGFCGFNLHKEADREKVMNELKRVVASTYTEAKSTKKRLQKAKK